MSEYQVQDHDEAFLRQISEADLISYMSDATRALKQMSSSKNLSALSEVYGLALSLMERHNGFGANSHRMTG
ncbi:hypothetical protein FF098_005580 [Parvularcula flava]|uniref:Uncharacterized protein n=1 Tax=Aquisalinus luteolus TaxID=1566827 RepID=A0A8J3A184_9PROT|nr:hypothetical protein [Aquisalinus luteolus]NHK27369.1 hypothetical protein [Aquisalinus luteolus]GGH95228.1 hypothetical protein GCM10011355_11270 [Aquisalinus luteolus]